MKKLLLTVATFGMMTSGGASAHVKYTVMGCPTVDEIVEGQKSAGKVAQFRLKSDDGVWNITNRSTAPKELVEATAALAHNNGFQIVCYYDNNINANLLKEGCKNFWKE